MSDKTIRFISEKDPKWCKDADWSSCKDCNVGFTFFNRKHHCRLCGQIFCDDCAPSSATLGVRVCRECGSLIRKRFGGDDAAIASLVKDNGPSFSSVLETAASGAGVGLLVGVAVVHGIFILSLTPKVFPITKTNNLYTSTDNACYSGCWYSRICCTKNG